MPGETYQQRLQAPWSRPSQAAWVAYDEPAVQADFWNLWRTGFLDDLWIEVLDEPYDNGVMGKHVVFHMEERARVKAVDYVGSDVVGVTKIEEALAEEEARIGLDAFVDQAAIRKVRAIIRRLHEEQGYHDARIASRLVDIPTAPKLVELIFDTEAGPRYRIHDIVFDGNSHVDDARLRDQMVANRPYRLLTLLSGAGAYREARFAEDAEAITRFYWNRGYVQALVGMPEVVALSDSDDGAVRDILLRIPVDEGARHRIGTFTVKGNTRLATDGILGLFELRPGDWFDRSRLDEGVEKVQQLYSRLGFSKVAVLPDFRFLHERVQTESSPPADGDEAVSDDPLVDIELQLVEGEQHFVNRITIVGNTTTQDPVIRRELRLLEGGVFDLGALQQSIRRINQLGYFQPIDGNGEEVQVQDVPGRDNLVDVILRVTEQNRNQITFGAGVSETEGLFGQLQYQTMNFMGRGETLSVSLQRGSQAVHNQIAFTEPWLFDRPISAGVQLFSRRIDYYLDSATLGYSEARNGARLTMGLTIAPFTRAFAGASVEVVETAVHESLLAADSLIPGTPALTAVDAARLAERSLSLSVVRDTVDNPFQPRRGVRLTAQMAIAGGPFGGDVSYIRPELEAIGYLPIGARMAVGARGQGGWTRPQGSTTALPYYRRFFLGGETQIRGVDFRSVGPLNDAQQVLGGNRFLLFNLEYYLDVGPVRMLAFHDAGQAFLETEPINLRRLRTSSGLEARVLVPFLNVPFRVIYAWNVFRDTFQPARTFKFAVGTTF